MKKFLLFCSLAALQTLSFGQSFSIQFINNSTSGAPDNLFPLDIYINDSLYASSSAVGVQSATELLSVPLQGNIRIAMAAAPSDSAGQAFTVYNLGRFVADKTYIALLNGNFGNPAHPFRLELAAGVDSFPSAEGRLQLRPFNGLGHSLGARFEVQRSEQPAPVLAAGQFGAFTAVRPGRQVLNFFTGNDPSPLRFALELPDSDRLYYTLIGTGRSDAFPLPALYAVATDGTVIPAQFLELPQVVINEIDYDQPGTDHEEFIELKNTGTEPIELAGLALELYNGSVGSAYDQIELPSETLAPQSYYVVCFSESVANCDLQVEGSIQNGGTAPDAVLLTQNAVIIDAVSYEGTLLSITEGSGVDQEEGEENTSISRLPDGMDTHNNAADFTSVCSTPGTTNLLNASCTLPSSPDSALVQLINDYEGPEQLRLLIGDRDLGLLSYQSATAFVKVPAGVVRNFSTLEEVNGTLISLLDTSLVFGVDSAYTFVLEGETAADLRLETNAPARAEAQVPFTTDFNFYYGLSEPGELDILIKRVGFATRELSSFGFSSYNSALPGSYLLDIIDQQRDETIATFELDLRTTGGASRTILISRAVDQPGGIELYSFDRLGNRVALPLVEFAQVQLIQNIPNIEVDVYIDDVLFADNVDYRAATTFLPLRANKYLSLEVKGAESTPADPPILAFDSLRFEALSSSLLVLGGDGTDSSPVDLFILKNASEAAADEQQLALSFFHGGTDINPLSFLGEQFEPIAVDLEFGRFADYQIFQAEDLVFAAREADAGRDLGFFGADLSSKNGQAGLVFSSGVVDDSQTFGLFVAFADGTVVPLSRRAYTRLQLVHNAPDSNAYDVLYRGKRLAEGLSFREATPYLNVPAGIAGALQLRFARPSGDSLLTVMEGFTGQDTLTYQLFLSGRFADATYPLQFAVYDQAQESTTLDVGLAITAHNGIFTFGAQNWSTEAGVLLAEQLAFGGFLATSGLPPAPQLIRISEQGTNRSLGAFDATLDQIAPGTALTLFTSGLRNSTFVPGLYAVLPDGTVLSFASTAFAKWQLVNSIDQPFDLYLDGALVESALSYRSAIPFQTTRAGVPHDLVVVPAGTVPTESEGLRLSFTAEAEEILSIFAAGAGAEASLFLNRNATDNAGGENKFVFNFFQGSSSEIALDLIIKDFTTLYRNVSFGVFSNYTLIEPLSSDPRVVFEVARSSGGGIIGVYDADFSSFGNQAMTIFTSGADGDDFALWAALSDGMTFPFSLITDLRTRLPEQLSVEVFPNPAVSVVHLQLELAERSDLTYTLMDLNGKVLLQKHLMQLPKGLYQERIAVGNLPAAVYLLKVNVGGKQALIRLSTGRP